MSSLDDHTNQDLSQLLAEAWSSDGTVGMALRDGEVVFLRISGDQLEQDKLPALADKLLAVHDKVLQDYWERALEALPARSMSTRERELGNIISGFAGEQLATAPSVPEPSMDGATAIEETGFKLWYQHAVLVAIEFDDAAWRLEARELESNLRAAFNRGFRLAEQVELSPPEPPTFEDLEELANRIHDLRRGIYR